MEKSIHKMKAEFVYLILWEKKINNLEITVIIFKIFKKCASLIQKNLIVQNFLPKNLFFFAFRNRPKASFFLCL